jgi:hypothetical protein
MISISAKIVHEEQQKTNGMVSTSKSIQSFQQSTSLPADADESNIKSEFKNGRLVITIGKKQPTTAAKATTTPPASQPAAETVKIPSLQEKKNEKQLPKIDEKLKKVQPASPKPNQKGEQTPLQKTVGDKDSII